MFNFLIAGAGIAGLASSIALARLGHQSTVLEQASELSQIGAGIQLGPNAMRILMSWGLGKSIMDKGFEPMQLIIRDARDDLMLTSRPLNMQGEAQNKYGAPHVCIRRSDLQNILLHAAKSLGVHVMLSYMVEGLHEERLAHFNALLGCDGLHSKVRQNLHFGTKHGGKPRASKHTAFRAMLDIALLPRELQNYSVQVWLGASQHVVAYPADPKTMNIVFVQVDAPTLNSPLSSMLRALVAAVQANSGFTAWALFDRPPLWQPQMYAKERVALLGDAAHPMLPYLAQGAAMAIEDAQALGHALACKPTIDKALEAYAQARWGRNARVQIYSQLQGVLFHASGGLRFARNAVLQTMGKRLTALPWLYA